MKKFIRAHPTQYAGVLFRSRLEARWASFFDLCKWRWEYEPSDDIGWVPDFLIINGWGSIAIEVKPIEWSNSEKGCVKEVKERPDLAKARTFDRDAVLVLGAYPLPCLDEHGDPMLGVLALGAEFRAIETAIFCGDGGGVPYDFHESHCRYTYYASGDSYCEGGYHNHATQAQMMAVWREAGNRTQWRGGAPAKRMSLFDD